MSAVGSLVFCTDCGNLLDSSTGNKNTILVCDCCGAENKGLRSLLPHYGHISHHYRHGIEDNYHPYESRFLPVSSAAKAFRDPAGRTFGYAE